MATDRDRRKEIQVIVPAPLEFNETTYLRRAVGPIANPKKLAICISDHKFCPARVPPRVAKSALLRLLARGIDIARNLNRGASWKNTSVA